MKSVVWKTMEATILKPGKVADTSVTDMLNFLSGGVGGIFLSLGINMTTMLQGGKN